MLDFGSLPVLCLILDHYQYYACSIHLGMIKPPEKWQPAVAENRAMYAGNGGPTKPDGYFLTPFMPKTMEMALPVPTKTFLPRSPDTAMLFAPSRCTHPPPPVPPFLLSQKLSPKDIAGSHMMKLKVL